MCSVGKGEEYIGKVWAESETWVCAALDNHCMYENGRRVVKWRGLHWYFELEYSVLLCWIQCMQLAQAHHREKSLPVAHMEEK